MGEQGDQRIGSHALISRAANRHANPALHQQQPCCVAQCRVLGAVQRGEAAAPTSPHQGSTGSTAQHHRFKAALLTRITSTYKKMTAISEPTNRVCSRSGGSGSAHHLSCCCSVWRRIPSRSNSVANLQLVVTRAVLPSPSSAPWLEPPGCRLRSPTATAPVRCRCSGRGRAEE